MLRNKSLVSIDDVSNEDLEEIFALSDRMLSVLESNKNPHMMDSKIMATLFYEPSTRTRLSFESAMHRLGGSVISMSDASSSSAAKGETLADTIRMAEGYSDIIVMRHPLEGAARLAAQFSSKPIINAGDGSGQHPTQTILDLFTMWKEFGKIDGLKIALIGDLKYGRTVHSLILALSRFNVELTLISPRSLSIPEQFYSRIPHNIKVRKSEKMEGFVEDADVLYVTRIQKERFADKNEYLSLIGSYSVDLKIVDSIKKEAIIMHPLPRIDEIKPEVDFTQNARYFKQASFGIPVRMALISMILGVN
jgi:aspartate carbamoyltransferase catalytic subunit